VTRLVRVSMALLAVVLMAHLSWAAESVRVTAERVNLRSGPNTVSPIVAKVTRGTILSVLSREGGWVRVAAPGSGVAAYISARLCEPAPAATAAPAATTSKPVTSGATSSEPTFARSGGKSEAEPLQFGGNVDFATNSVGFGIGIRASRGIPVSVLRNLGALATFDFFFGAHSQSDVAGVDTSGHSFQFGLYPTYSYEFGSIRAYGGAGLSILGASYSTSTPALDPAADPIKVSGSAWDTSLGVVAGAKFKGRFFGEVRYQFGAGKHLTFSAGVMFNSPF
jgi:hypothetical protein